MDKKRLGLQATAAALAALMCLVWAPASAAGFGEPTRSAVMGDFLDFAVPVRLEADVDVDPRCLKADVRMGEHLLPGALVSTAIERTGLSSARLRVGTSRSVDEPLVSILLTVGCASSSSRLFVVLADPPGLMPLGPLSNLAPVPAPMFAPVFAPAALSAAPMQSDAVGRKPARLAEARVRVGVPGQATVAAPPAAPSPRVQAASTNARPTAAEDTAWTRTPQWSAGPARQRQPDLRLISTSLVAAGGAPRLRLEAPLAEPGPISAGLLAAAHALQAVADATSVMTTAWQAASAAEERTQSLEQASQQLDADAQAQGVGDVAWRERLARAEATANWVWPLLLGLFLLVALVGWLAWQMMSLRREQRQGWQSARAEAVVAATAAGLGLTAHAVARSSANAMQGAGEHTEESVEEGAAADALAGRTPTLPATFVTLGLASSGIPDTVAASSVVVPSGTYVRTPATPAWPPPAPCVDFAHSVPASDLDIDAVAGPAATGTAADSTSSRAPNLGGAVTVRAAAPSVASATPALSAVSADAEAATRDLSIEELIDLEQQADFFVVLGQDEAAIGLLVDHARSTGGSSPLPYLKLLEIYQRLGDREAFERTRQRFNQRFNAYAAEWGTPPEQGRGLETYANILLRLAQAWPRPLDAMAELETLLFRKSNGELFDLPAYREVLFLYALARDLLDREAAATGTVDLLLPLADGGEFSVTAPHPYFGLDRDSVFDSDAADATPASSVDLDLTQDESRARIIDPLPPRRLKKP